MKTALVSGQFVTPEGVPVDGEIKFLPSRLWIEEGEQWFPTFAPEMELDNGRFTAQLTVTDDQTYGDWHYDVVSPIGTWSIQVTSEGRINLADLLPERFRRT